MNTLNARGLCRNLDQRTVRFFLVSLLQEFEESRRNIFQISQRAKERVHLTMCKLREWRTWGLLTSVSVSCRVKPLGHQADKTPHLSPNCWSPQSDNYTFFLSFFFFTARLGNYYLLQKDFFYRKTQGLSVTPVLHPFVTLQNVPYNFLMGQWSEPCLDFLVTPTVIVS